MAAQCFWVALGGALGAVSRYLCGMFPFLQRGIFPCPRCSSTWPARFSSA